METIFSRLLPGLIGVLLASPMWATEPVDTKQLLKTYAQVWNSGEVDFLDEILAPGFVHYDRELPPRTSIEVMKEQIRGMHAQNSELQLVVHDVIAGPEQGAMRFSVHGVYDPTGDRFEYINLAMYRFAGGKIAEERVQGDSISYLADLGYRMVPPGYRMIAPPVENASLYNVEPVFPNEGALRDRAMQFSTAASKQAGSIEIKTDAGCRLNLDGREFGWLNAGSTVAVKLDRGTHTLQAISPAGAIFFQESVELKKKEQLAIAIPSPGRIIANPREGTSEDLTTGLMWLMQDTGQGFTWFKAKEYCENLELAGHTDWRLPTIFELDDIYTVDSPRDFKTVNGITVSNCCPWSSTLHGENMAWIYVFYKGARYLQHKTFGGGPLLALCVRDALPRQRGSVGGMSASP